MPIYEYHCPKCQKIFEEWVHISEGQSTVPCPDCGTEAQRIMSETSFVLKGSGWYVTDYGYRKGVHDEDSKASTGTAATSSSATATPKTKSASKAPKPVTKPRGTTATAAH